MLKRTNEEGWQRLWGFPRPEITWMLIALFQKLCVGSPHLRITVIFYAQNPNRHGIFFIGTCKSFHRFSTKYSLNNNILNFEKILCVTFYKNHMIVGQKLWFLNPDLLDNQQKTISKPSYGFDRFFLCIRIRLNSSRD